MSDWQSYKRCGVNPNQVLRETRFVSRSWRQRFLLRLADLLPVSHRNSLGRLKNSSLRRAGISIEDPVFIDVGFRCIRPAAIAIERWVSLGHDNNIWAFAPVRIGHHTMTAKDLLIMAGTHDASTFEPLDGQGVEIGPGCWIGARVTILGGVKIGKGCVIGACSLVRTSLPDWSIAVGVPARILRRREPAGRIWHQFGYYPVSDLD